MKDCWWDVKNQIKKQNKTGSFVSWTHPALSKLLSNVKCLVDLLTLVFPHIYIYIYICSGQSPLNISRVPFHERFHGANSETCSHTGKTGSERQTEPTKFVWFSHFLYTMQVSCIEIPPYSSKRIAATNTVALSAAPYIIERLNWRNVNCTSWRDFDVNGKLFYF